MLTTLRSVVVVFLSYLPNFDSSVQAFVIHHATPSLLICLHTMSDLQQLCPKLHAIPLHALLCNSASPVTMPYQTSFDSCARQWAAADAEIKVPSGENTELKRSPFKAWSGSVYSHTCYAYCQRFLPCLLLPSGPFTYIFPKPLPIFHVLAVANTWFLCRPAD